MKHPLALACIVAIILLGISTLTWWLVLPAYVVLFVVGWGVTDA